MGSDCLRSKFNLDINRIHHHSERSRKHFFGKHIFPQPLSIKGEDRLGPPRLYPRLQGA